MFHKPFDQASAGFSPDNINSILNVMGKFSDPSFLQEQTIKHGNLLYQIQKNVLDRLPIFFDREDECVIKEAIIRKLHCVLKLRQILNNGRMKATTLLYSSNLFAAVSQLGKTVETSIVFQMNQLTSYIPLKYLTSSVAMATADLEEAYQQFRSTVVDVRAVVRKMAPHLEAHQQLLLVQCIEDTRNAVIQYSEGYFALERSIQDLRRQHGYSSRQYAEWQQDLLLLFCDQTVEFVNNPRNKVSTIVKLGARGESNFTKRVLLNPRSGPFKEGRMVSEASMDMLGDFFHGVSMREHLAVFEEMAADDSKSMPTRTSTPEDLKSEMAARIAELEQKKSAAPPASPAQRFLAACQEGNFSTVQEFIKKEPALRTLKALVLAAKSGHEKVVRELLKSRELVRSLNAFYKNENPLLVAVQGGHPGVVKALLSYSFSAERLDQALALADGHPAIKRLLTAKREKIAVPHEPAAPEKPGSAKSAEATIPPEEGKGELQQEPPFAAPSGIKTRFFDHTEKKLAELDSLLGTLEAFRASLAKQKMPGWDESSQRVTGEFMQTMEEYQALSRQYLEQRPKAKINRQIHKQLAKDMKKLASLEAAFHRYHRQLEEMRQAFSSIPASDERAPASSAKDQSTKSSSSSSSSPSRMPDTSSRPFSPELKQEAKTTPAVIPEKESHALIVYRRSFSPLLFSHSAEDKLSKSFAFRQLKLQHLKNYLAFEPVSRDTAQNTALVRMQCHSLLFEALQLAENEAARLKALRHEEWKREIFKAIRTALAHGKGLLNEHELHRHGGEIRSFTRALLIFMETHNLEPLLTNPFYCKLLAHYQILREQRRQGGKETISELDRIQYTFRSSAEMLLYLNYEAQPPQPLPDGMLDSALRMVNMKGQIYSLTSNELINREQAVVDRHSAAIVLRMR